MSVESNRLKFLKIAKLTSSVFLESKRKKLASLIQTNAHLPDQGTKEWLDLRRFHIGGSEIGVLTGDNKFSNMKKLIAGKVGLCNFKGVMATRWGKAFEKVTTLIMQSVLDVDGSIQETSSLEGGIPNQRFSPDGLAVIKMICGGRIDGEYIECSEYVTVLFEFKSPYSSVPDGVIPKYYMPQVLAGLCSIPIADFGLFVNNMYRKCSLSQFDVNSDYDTKFHNKDEGKVEVGRPIALGFILVYVSEDTYNKIVCKYGEESEESEESDESDESDESEESEESEESDESDEIDLLSIVKMQRPEFPTLVSTIVSRTGSKLVDFGKSNYYEFDELLSLFDNKLVDFHYCDPLIIRAEACKIPLLQGQRFSSQGQLDLGDYKAKLSAGGMVRELKSERVKKIVGYIPYKLFKSDMIVVNRDETYLKRCNDKVQETVGVIKDIMGCTEYGENMVEIHERFRKYYPIKNDCIDREINANVDSYLNEHSRKDMIPNF